MSWPCRPRLTVSKSITYKKSSTLENTAVDTNISSDGQVTDLNTTTGSPVKTCRNVKLLDSNGRHRNQRYGSFSTGRHSGFGRTHCPAVDVELFFFSLSPETCFDFIIGRV